MSSPQPDPRLLCDTARHDGPGRALTALHRHAGEGTLVYGPAGHALAPAQLVASATHACHAGHVRERIPAGERDLTTPLLAGLGLAAVQSPATGLTDDRATDRAWDTAALWLRLGLTQRLLDAVLAHLGQRTFSDTPLLQNPVLKDALADAATGLLETESGLLDAPAHGLDDTALHLLHHKITATDRALLKLLGANGLTVDGPGHSAYVSEVLADLYAPADLFQEAA